MVEALPSQTRDTLKRLGAALDKQQTIRVRNGGFSALPSQTVQEEQDDERQGTPRSPAESGQRAEGAWGPADGSRSAGETAPVRSGDLRLSYEAGLADAQAAYPTLQVIGDLRGLWLRFESAVLEGLNRTAVFFVAVPYDLPLFPRAWAFWDTKGRKRWIGPRHTNMPDGSVCAYVPGGEVWEPGGPLVELFDLYTEWALRHLHLEELKRWPGPQTSPHPYYRVKEFRGDELCSCESGKVYKHCHKPDDESQPLGDLKADFLRTTPTGLLRRPPPEIVAFAEGRVGFPPHLSALKFDRLR